MYFSLINLLVIVLTIIMITNWVVIYNSIDSNKTGIYNKNNDDIIVITDNLKHTSSSSITYEIYLVIVPYLLSMCKTHFLWTHLSVLTSSITFKDLIITCDNLLKKCKVEFCNIAYSAPLWIKEDISQFQHQLLINDNSLREDIYI